MAAHMEVDEIVYRDWEETAARNATLERIVRGVAAVLGVDEGGLRGHAAKILSRCLIDGCPRQDEVLALRSAIETIYDTLLDADAWNAYADRPGPPAMRYAAAAAAYMYLLAEYYGALVPLGCPLFHPRVASLVLEYLATRQAPADATVKRAIYDAVIELERRSGRRIRDPLEPCHPPR
jgi:hypothetical protein